jgi:hypothetical protein
MAFSLLSLLTVSPSISADFCVSDSIELQNALSTAAGNNQDDEIKIVQGTYVGSFVYVSNEAFDLDVEGGYISGCGSRTVDPVNTVLDANNAGPVLVFTTDQEVDLMVEGLTIQNGTTDNGNGGGLYAHTVWGEITITNNTIVNNSATGGVGWGSGGGGVHVDVGFGTAILKDNTINNNSAEVQGGGVFVRATDGTAILRGNTISNNFAGWDAGGVWVGDLYATAILTDNTISNNSSGGGDGGGVNVQGSATLTGNTISNNSAYRGGGGVYVNTFSESIPIPAKLVNNVICGNNSSFYGGGLHIWGGGDVTITNNTVTNNICQPCRWGGGGIDLYLISDTQTADIYNNISWGNTAPSGADIDIDNDGDDNYFPSTVNLFNNDFDQSGAGFFVEIPFSVDPSNLDNLDPQFANVTNEDYHLQTDSPVIDMGNQFYSKLPATDKDGNLRVFDGDGNGPATVDMGAFEYGSSPPITPLPDIKANFSDGPITIADFDNLIIEVTIDSGIYTGYPADYWILANSPFGWYYYHLSAGWLAGQNVTYQGPLIDLNPFEVMDTTLPEGDYTFYFGVDGNMNGVIDMGQMYYDSVDVTVTP